MTAKAKIEISREALAVAEKNAADNGFPSADAYVEALLMDDYDGFFRQPWVKEKIEEGLASEDAGELTKDVIAQLVQEGIASAKRDK